MPSLRTVYGVLLIAAFLSGCSGSLDEPAPPARDADVDESPWMPETVWRGPEDSLAPRLVTNGEGGLLLSWLERLGGERARLRFLEVDEEGPGAPRTVVEGDDLFINWADTPGVVRSGEGILWAWWLQQAGEDTYAYHVRVARSRDDGGSWSAAELLHTDRSPTEHGFVSVVPARKGIAAVWLDGRATGGGHGEGSGAMQLRFTTLGSRGERGREVLLDPRVCDCCPTDLAATGRAGYLALYRGRTDEEVRDIAAVRRPGLGGWRRPVEVSEEGWVLEGCPVNGPALAVQGGWRAAVWFTAEGDEPRVQAAFSRDGGATWGESVRVDGGRALGRVDGVLLADGSLVASWMELVDEQAEIKLRRLTPGEGIGAPRLVATTGGLRASGFPRMVLRGEDLWVAWTSTEGESTRVILSKLPALGPGESLR